MPSDSVCKPVEKYDNYKVTEFGEVAGAAKMKAEIYARGTELKIFRSKSLKTFI